MTIHVLIEPVGLEVDLLGAYLTVESAKLAADRHNSLFPPSPDFRLKRYFIAEVTLEAPVDGNPPKFPGVFYP